MSDFNVIKVLNKLDERSFSYEKVVYDPTRKIFKIISTKALSRNSEKKISDRKPKTRKEKVHAKISRKISNNNKQASKLSA